MLKWVTEAVTFLPLLLVESGNPAWEMVAQPENQAHTVATTNRLASFFIQTPDSVEVR
jgi:hypothetical protein